MKIKRYVVGVIGALCFKIRLAFFTICIALRFELGWIDDGTIRLGSLDCKFVAGRDELLRCPSKGGVAISEKVKERKLVTESLDGTSIFILDLNNLG